MSTEIQKNFETRPKSNTKNFQTCECKINLEKVTSSLSKHKPLHLVKKSCPCKKTYYFFEDTNSSINTKVNDFFFSDKLHSLPAIQQQMLSDKFMLKSFVIQKLDIDTHFEIIPKLKLDNENWICVSEYHKFIQEYKMFLEMFCTECNTISNPETKKSNDLLAVQLISNKLWYRAYLLTNGKEYALIDEGEIINSTQIFRVMSCPKPFVELPAFSFIFKCDEKANIQIKKPATLIILHKDNNEGTAMGILIKSGATYMGKEEIYGVFKSWDPIQHLIGVKKIVEIKMSLPKLTDIPIMSDEIEIKKNDTVVLMNYSNGKELYIRTLDKKINKDYIYNLSLFTKAWETVDYLSAPPSPGELVLYEDTLHKQCFRAEILYVGKSGVCELSTIDIGGKKRVLYKNLKYFYENLTSIPITIIKISLCGCDAAELNNETISYFNNLISKKCPLSYNFECADFTVIDVQLREVKTSNLLNSVIRKIMLPIKERLEEESSTIYDLKVYYESDIESINLKDYSSVLVSNSTLNIKSICCVPYDVDIQDTFYRLQAEIQKYCNEYTNPYLPREKELCLALSAQDKKFHRAAVMGFLGSRKEVMRVTLIDNGRCEDVSWRNTRKMLPYFIDPLPALAVLCSLADLPDPWDESNIMKAKDYISNNQPIKITYVLQKEDKDVIIIPDLNNYLSQ